MGHGPDTHYISAEGERMMKAFLDSAESEMLWSSDGFNSHGGNVGFLKLRQTQTLQGSAEADADVTTGKPQYRIAWVDCDGIYSTAAFGASTTLRSVSSYALQTIVKGVERLVAGPGKWTQDRKMEQMRKAMKSACGAYEGWGGFKPFDRLRK